MIVDCTPWEKKKYLGEGEEFAEEHSSNSSFFHPLIYKPLIYKL